MFKSLRQIWQALFPEPLEPAIPTLLKVSDISLDAALAKNLEDLALILYSLGLDATHQYRAQRRQAVRDGKPVDAYDMGYSDGVWDAVDLLKLAATGDLVSAEVPDAQDLVKETSRLSADRRDDEDFKLDIPQWVNGDKKPTVKPVPNSLHPKVVRDELSGLGGDAA